MEYNDFSYFYCILGRNISKRSLSQIESIFCRDVNKMNKRTIQTVSYNKNGVFLVSIKRKIDHDFVLCNVKPIKYDN